MRVRCMVLIECYELVVTMSHTVLLVMGPVEIQ